MAATILLSMCPFRSWGQDDQGKPSQLIGGFETEGSVTTGYRFTTVKGDEAQYDDLFDLHKGLRLMDVNVMGRAPEGSNAFADSYSVTASGLGGDPSENGQLTVRKDKLYDLRVNYRQSYYDWSQNNIDSQVVSMPTPSGYTTGLTPDHSWATVRKMGSANLNLQATNHLQFSFEYSRNSRDGMAQTTRTMYFNANDASLSSAISPGYSGFTHGDPFLMAAPVNELTDRITGGISYTLRNWTFHYRVGYQSFSQNESWNNLTSPEYSIDTSPLVVAAAPPYNIGAITQNEPLTYASWSELRRLTTPVSEFSYNGKVNSWLELRGGYNYYSYSGPDRTDASLVGIMRATSNPTSTPPPAVPYTPYNIDVHNRATVAEPSHAITQGLTAKIKPWWNFYADYRYTRDTTDGINNYNSIYTAYAAKTTTLTAYPTAPGTEENKWTIGTHFVDLTTEFTPTSSLVIRAGITYVKRDVAEDTNGVENTFVDVYLPTPLTTVETKSIWPKVSVFYKPVKIFSVRGDFQSNTSSDPYTPISAHTDVGTRFVFRLQPIAKVSIEDNLQVRDREYSANSFRNQYRANAIDVSYDLSDRFSGNFGYSYESLFGTDAVTISATSTTTPFVGFQQDAFVNRGLRGAFIIKPTKRFGINVSGNFLRTTGASQLFSNKVAPLLGVPIVWLPSTGPLTFPLMTGTLYYEFPKAGRLSVDLQRTYYVEQLVRGNNFQANMLTIKWTTNLFTNGFFGH
jgi:hypothetical protein